MAYQAPDVDDLFLPLMDILDQKKTLSKISLIKEMQIEFSQVTPETLNPNIEFCINRLIEAEMIEEIQGFIRLSPKGKKVLLSNSNELGLKEIAFYGAHDTNFFGQPPGGLKLKNYLKRKSDTNLHKLAVYTAIGIAGAIILYFVAKIQDKGSETIWNETFKPLDNQLDQALDEATKEVEKDFKKNR
ncbi:MAG: hypothetical protein ACOYL6_12910 [Bacteriovoracaceae bacterium]